MYIHIYIYIYALSSQPHWLYIYIHAQYRWGFPLFSWDPSTHSPISVKPTTFWCHEVKVFREKPLIWLFCATICDYLKIWYPQLAMQNRVIIELRIPHETKPYSLPGRNLTADLTRSQFWGFWSRKKSRYRYIPGIPQEIWIWSATKMILKQVDKNMGFPCFFGMAGVVFSYLASPMVHLGKKACNCGSSVIYMCVYMGHIHIYIYLSLHFSMNGWNCHSQKAPAFSPFSPVPWIGASWTACSVGPASQNSGDLLRSDLRWDLWDVWMVKT